MDSDNGPRLKATAGRFRAALWSDYGVRIEPKSASMLVGAILNVETPADHVEVSDQAKSVVLTWAQVLAMIQPEFGSGSAVPSEERPGGMVPRDEE